MVVNFALTKNLKRYSRSALNRRRAIYKLMKAKKAVKTHTKHPFKQTQLPFLNVLFFNVARRKEAC